VKDSRVKNPEMAENWWNIYRYDDKVERITSLKAEFGEPHWVFGQSRYDFLSDGRILTLKLKGWHLLKQVSPLTGAYTLTGKTGYFLSVPAA